MPNNSNFSNVTGGPNIDPVLTPNSTGNIYTESVGNTNLRALMDLQDINTITHKANGLLASITDIEKRARIIEYFYDKVLLDSIKIGTENNVYLKYCKTKEVPAGNAKLVLRRWGGLTEHTYPLAEGIPPKSDRMASESFTGTFCQYGRYMEFTDRVDFQLIDDVISHYSAEMGDVAVRTAERLCREEMIFFSNPIYPGAKSGISELVIGDTIGIEDYRLQALKFQRILVKPINGNYIVICSPEHIYDLVSDDLVLKYMELTHTAEPYKTGKPVDLFNIRFEQTMLDDFSYGYTELSNPGEFFENGKYGCRIVAINNETGQRLYTNMYDEDVVGPNEEDLESPRKVLKDVYLKDGSAIPERVIWDLPTILNFPSATEDWYDEKGNSMANQMDTLITQSWTFRQLPVHRSFMFGEEHMIKTGISGRSGAKFYVKAKGSAGVLDPIDQRQSFGFKIDTLGFTCVRPEALVQFIFVPKNALVTYGAVIEDWDKHFNDKQYSDKSQYPNGSIYAAIKRAE